MLRAALNVTVAQTFLELIADLNPKNQEAPRKSGAESNKTSVVQRGREDQ